MAFPCRYTFYFFIFRSSPSAFFSKAFQYCWYGNVCLRSAHGTDHQAPRHSIANTFDINFHISGNAFYYRKISSSIPGAFYSITGGHTDFRGFTYGSVQNSCILEFSPVNNCQASHRITSDIRCVAPRALLGSRTLRGTFRFAPFFRCARARRIFW